MAGSVLTPGVETEINTEFMYSRIKLALIVSINCNFFFFLFPKIREKRLACLDKPAPDWLKHKGSFFFKALQRKGVISNLYTARPTLHEGE